VACTATDTAGNVTPCSFSVTVEDREPPVITCPGNLVAEFQNEQGAVVPCVVTASDTCSPVAVTVTPPCGSVFPIGLTTVNALALETSGNSNSCSFTVRVLGAFGVKSNVLAELIALRSTVTAKDDGDKLDQAIQKLTESLDASLWLDQTHLERKHGEKVFQGEKDAAIKLCDLIKSPRSTIPDAVLQGFLERIVKSDRLLAQVAINEAIVAQVAAKKIAEAQKELAKGDEEATDGKCGDGIERYRQAWKHAVHSKVYSYIDKENGQLHLEILGKPHEQFTVQVSTNLVDWQTIATQAADADGLLDFVDAHAGEPGVRYYRAVSQ
jgi:hypothetical protein